MATIIRKTTHEDGSESKALAFTFTRGESDLINETASEHYLRQIRNAAVAVAVLAGAGAVGSIITGIVIALHTAPTAGY